MGANAGKVSALAREAKPMIPLHRHSPLLPHAPGHRFAGRSLAAGVLVIAVIAALVAPALAAQLEPEISPAEEPWVVHVATTDRGLIDRLAQGADLWNVDPEKGRITLAVGAEEYRDLVAEGLAEGFEVEIDTAATAALHAPRRGVEGQVEGQVGGIPGFPCYRTVEETLATGEALATVHPDLATWIDIGDSWDKSQGPPGSGYDLRVLRLTQSAVPGPKPKLYVNGGIHAREYTTAELATRFAEYLIAGYGVDADATWLLDQHEVHLLLQANPDGRKRAEAGTSWRKNTNDDACSIPSAFGIDLNRNFEFQWGCCGGSSSDGCSVTYRGTGPASEPEDQAIQAYLRSILPDQRPPDLTTPAPADATGIALDLHSYGEDVLWSWGFTTTQPPNGAALYTLGRKLAYFNGYRPQHGSLNTVDGSTKDFAYGDLGVAGFTVELGTAFFQNCAVFESTILPSNLETLLYALKVVRTPYQTPAGPDVVTPVLSSITAAPGDLVELNALADDTRYSTANGTEPSQTVIAAEYYLDVPPWGTSPAPRSLSAADGTFDSPVEALDAVIDTAGLDLGRHLVLLRAQDAGGAWGALSALFLELRDLTPLFGDGFESGDASAWSAVVPGPVSPPP